MTALLTVLYGKIVFISTGRPRCSLRSDLIARRLRIWGTRKGYYQHRLDTPEAERREVFFDQV